MVGLLLCMFEVPQRQQLASEDSVPETPSYGTEWTFGAQNSLLWYATHLQRCAKQPPAPPNAFSKAQKRHPATLNASSEARRTADSTDCGQPPAAPNASSKACRAKSSTCRTGRIFSAQNGLREEASKHKKRVLIKVYQDFLATLLSLIVLYSD